MAPVGMIAEAGNDPLLDRRAGSSYASALALQNYSPIGIGRFAKAKKGQFRAVLMAICVGVLPDSVACAAKRRAKRPLRWRRDRDRRDRFKAIANHIRERRSTLEFKLLPSRLIRLLGLFPLLLNASIPRR